MRERLLECLGGPWPKGGPLEVETIADPIAADVFRIESLSFATEPAERIPALLLVPDAATAERPAPAVAVWHQHDDDYALGKSEPAGLAGDPAQHAGAALARLGYVVVCIDALGFEDRRDPSGRLEGGDYERFVFLDQVLRGRSLAWKNILDMRRAIDLLDSRPEVDGARIGCYGHSMGSTHAWLVGPWEPRLRCVVGNACLPTYEAIAAEHLTHNFSNFIPGWWRHGDTPEIAALIAPRALHLNLGEDDPASPIDSARAGIERIAQVYAEAGAADQFSAFIEPGAGHETTEAMWRQTVACLSRHLGGGVV